MDWKKILFWGAIMVGGYYLIKKTGILGGGSLSGVGRGLGAYGEPRRGKPKTEAERLATHRSLFGNEVLPPRGTGLSRRGF